jgi:hypothetical protein
MVNKYILKNQHMKSYTMIYSFDVIIDVAWKWPDKLFAVTPPTIFEHKQLCSMWDSLAWVMQTYLNIFKL